MVRVILVLSILSILLSLSASAFADNEWLLNWNGNGDSNSWSDANNWQNGAGTMGVEPNITHRVFINTPADANGVPTVGPGCNAICGELCIAPAEANVVMCVNGGTLDVNDNNLNNLARLTIGADPCSSGTLNLSSGLITTDGEVYIGGWISGRGTLNQSGGTLRSNKFSIYFGYSDFRSYGAYNFSGGLLQTIDPDKNAYNGDVYIGYLGSADVNMTGGTINAIGNICTTSWHYLPPDEPTRSTVTMSRGKMICSQAHNFFGLFIGVADLGIFNMNGGDITCQYGFLALGDQWGASPAWTSRGVLNLNGGVIKCKWILIDKLNWSTPYLHKSRYPDPNSLIDLRGGIIKVQGDKRTTPLSIIDTNALPGSRADGINNLVTAGYIKAYGGDVNVSVTYVPSGVFPDGNYTLVRADCPYGDLTSDCHVDISDIAVMARNWLDTECALGDLNGDCLVNFRDYAVLARNWLK